MSALLCMYITVQSTMSSTHARAVMNSAAGRC